MGPAGLTGFADQLRVWELDEDLGGTSIDVTGSVSPDYLVELLPLSLTGASGEEVWLEATGSVFGDPTVFSSLDLVGNGVGFQVKPDMSPDRSDFLI